jgi:hypothetical protein
VVLAFNSDSIQSFVIDNSRNLIYCLTKENHLDVFGLTLDELYGL